MPAPVVFPNNRLNYLAGLDIEDDRYQFEMDWNYRTNSWHASITRVSDNALLVAYRRVSPGALLLDVPEGQFWVGGSDSYGSDAFATGDLRILYWTRAELDAAEAAIDADPVPTIVE